jgi:ParB family chromosome partitioning protein
MAKLRDHEAIQTKTDMFRVDPRKLRVEPGFNVRNLDAPTAREALDELKASIAAEGVQVPLEIRMIAEDLFVVSGHRRLKVTMELIDEGHEILTVPAIPEPRAISEADRMARLITLNQGEPLTPLEKAEVVRRLLGYGWDRSNIARRLGFKTVQTIANYELLLSAPSEVREAVREGEVSASNAVEMVRASGPAATETLTAARETAAAAGKKRVTARSIAPKPKSKKSATVNGAGSTIDPTEAANNKTVREAMMLLNRLVDNDYAVSEAAAAFMLYPPERVARIAEWVYEFEDRVKAKHDAQRDEDANMAYEAPTADALPA